MQNTHALRCDWRGGSGESRENRRTDATRDELSAQRTSGEWKKRPYHQHARSQEHCVCGCLRISSLRNRGVAVSVCCELSSTVTLA
jgi:hypothetical protein